MKKIFFMLVIVWVIAGFFYPVVPFPAKSGYHGIGGEFCGIVYRPECDKVEIRMLKFGEIKYVLDLGYKSYSEVNKSSK